MKKVEKLNYQTIEERSAKVFDEKLNNLVEEIALCEPDVRRLFEPSIGYIAFVEWKELIIEPEDARDEYKLKGIEYCCGECPFFKLSEDRRVKKAICEQGEKTYYDRPACAELYERIKKGEVVI